jgi:hypothetical protein
MEKNKKSYSLGTFQNCNPYYIYIIYLFIFETLLYFGDMLVETIIQI